MWRVNSSLRVNFQPHPFHRHAYGFSPVCVLRWAFKWLDLVYVLVQPSLGQLCMTVLRSGLVLHFRALVILPDFVNFTGTNDDSEVGI